jgi:hypothetical protein
VAEALNEDRAPGFLGFLSFVFLIIAVVLLYRSMQKQLKKVDPNLPEGPVDLMREEDRQVIEEAQARGAREARDRMPKSPRPDRQDPPGPDPASD